MCFVYVFYGDVRDGRVMVARKEAKPLINMRCIDAMDGVARPRINTRSIDATKQEEQRCRSAKWA